MRPLGVLTVVLVALAYGDAFGVGSVTLRQGVNEYGDTTDSYMHEDGKGRNFGGSQLLYVYYDSGGVDMNILLKFGLSGQIPLDQRIRSAELRLWYADDYNLGTGQHATVYVNRLLRSWYENVYDDVDVNQGVNWNYADQNETVAWTSGGAMAQGSDTDWNDGNGTATIGKEGESGVDVPQQWVHWNVTNTLKKWYGTLGRSGQLANNGFLMTDSLNTGTTGGGIFGSRNGSLVEYRPELYIEWEGALLPIAEANGPYSVVHGGTVNLSGAGSNDPDGGTLVEYLWDLDLDGQYDDASGIFPNVSYSYLHDTLGLAPGDHTITLRVKDDEGEYDTDSASITLGAIPEPGSLLLVATAALGLLGRIRRSRMN